MVYVALQLLCFYLGNVCCKLQATAADQPSGSSRTPSTPLEADGLNCDYNMYGVLT
jgi:hypothetical protein